MTALKKRLEEPTPGPKPGDRCQSASGRIWTVRLVTRVGGRVVLVTPGPDGERAAVMDLGALAQMTRMTHRRPRRARHTPSTTTALTTGTTKQRVAG
jgi:hypothetical protein